MVILDEKGKVLKVVAAYDVGTPVNPKAVEGQIEGGIVMGLGYALTEDFKTEGGYPKTKFGTLGLIRATESPEIEIKLVKGPGKIHQAYGAKGVGELCLIPTAPACSHGYYRLDKRLRTELPLKDTFYKKEK